MVRNDKEQMQKY